MSIDHAQDFHKQMGENEEMHTAVKAASEKVLEIAKQNGLDFTREELAEVLANKWKAGADSDDDGADPATSFLSERPGF